MGALRRPLGNLQAGEWALVAVLLAVVLACAYLFVRPDRLYGLLGLPPDDQIVTGQGGPRPLPSPGSR